MSTDNLAIWTAVEKTDPSHTKNFQRTGGFKGTAMNATWLAQRATELFGPCGIGWGMTVIDEQYIKCAPIMHNEAVAGYEIVHVVHAKLWYIRDGQRGEIEQFGQTQMVGRNSRGIFTDEEAPKKSMTDAMSKCLSMLGFGADIFKGLYDDNKYVRDLREEFAGEAGNEQGMAEDRPRRPQRDNGSRLTTVQHMKAIEKADTVSGLKSAFALAWKQYEQPGDPGAKTEAQLKFKAAYDKRLKQLDITKQQHDEPGGEADQVQGEDEQANEFWPEDMK